MHQFNLMLVLYFIILSPWYIRHIKAAECNTQYGPAGTFHCIKLSHYYDYQWAFCRTDAYILTTSKNKHHCRDRTVTYCYYQCMVDVYGKNYGAVSSNCRCSPGSPQPTESVRLPAWCYSPDGTDCSWYRECLNKAYPSCENDKDDYAIKYAQKFCELYNARYEKFSLKAKQWVNAVRKCLQVKLVPLIDKTRTKNCADLKTKAFETHTPCYLNPDESSPSYCDLSLKDRFKIFWTIKSAFKQAFFPSIGGVLSVSGGCIQARVDSAVQYANAKIQEGIDIIYKGIDKIYKGIDKIYEQVEQVEQAARDIITGTNEQIKNWLHNHIPPIQLDISLILNDLLLQRRKKRSITNDDTETARSYLAGKIIDAVALEQQWEDKGVAWFAYSNNETAQDGNFTSIRLLVADRFTYEIPGAYNNSTPSFTKPANLTTILAQLSEAVLRGTLNLKIDGENVEISKMNGCFDWNCTEHAFNITKLNFPKPAASNVARGHRATSALSFAYFSLLIIISLLFKITY